MIGGIFMAVSVVFWWLRYCKLFYNRIEDKSTLTGGAAFFIMVTGAFGYALVMTFLVNGFGYHILVHALPIQVAGQASLTGVVTRAIGMMYLVDLDDTKGLTLTIHHYSRRRRTRKAYRQ